MSRAKREPGSSLELLLDTMCNAFGGVMFIAIALAVVAIAIPEPSGGNTSEILDEKLLRDRLDELKTRKMMLKHSTGDPGVSERDAADIARLEVLERKASDEVALRRAAIARVDALKQITTVDQSRLIEQKAEAEAFKSGLIKLRDELAALRRSHTRTVFPALAGSSLAPYFILLESGQVWRVGPEVEAGRFVPSDDVTASGPDDRVSCKPKPGCGVPVFADGKFTPEFERVLSGIPAGRAPKFVLKAGSAEQFSVIREELKQRKTVHGFIMQVKDDDFTYTVGEHARYEY